MRKARNGFIKNLHYLCLTGVIALGLITIVGSNGDGDGVTAPSGTCVDVAGYWSTTEVVDNRDCDGNIYTEYNTYTVTQDGCNITVVPSTGGTFSGTVNGNQVSWTGSYPAGGGTETLTVSLTFSGDTFTGSASWTYTEGTYTCSGTTQITGTRFVTAPPTTVTGTWEFHLKCAVQEGDAAVFNISINESSGGAFTGSGTGTDYDGTPMQVTIIGNYNSSTHVLTAEITTTFEGNPCVRKDTFSVTLTSNDTGYIAATQTEYCGCDAEVRLIKT